MAIPAAVADPAELLAVSAADPVSAWVVGDEASTGSESGTPLILHWDGLAWSKVTLSGVAAPGSPTSVSAGSPSDAWALGTDASGPVLLHWDGQARRQVRFPG